MYRTSQFELVAKVTVSVVSRRDRGKGSGSHSFDSVDENRVELVVH